MCKNHLQVYYLVFYVIGMIMRLNNFEALRKSCSYVTTGTRYPLETILFKLCPSFNKRSIPYQLRESFLFLIFLSLNVKTFVSAYITLSLLIIHRGFIPTYFLVLCPWRVRVSLTICINTIPTRNIQTNVYIVWTMTINTFYFICIYSVIYLDSI